MKKLITLEEAFNLIQKSWAVVIDGDGLCYPSIDELTGDSDNKWLYCSWDDSDFNEYAVSFIEEEQEIYFDGTTIYMKDSEDEDTKITLLVKMGTN